MCFASESVQEENTLMKDKKVAGCSPTGPKEETEVAEGERRQDFSQAVT